MSEKPILCLMNTSFRRMDLKRRSRQANTPSSINKAPISPQREKIDEQPLLFTETPLQETPDTAIPIPFGEQERVQGE